MGRRVVALLYVVQVVQSIKAVLVRKAQVIHRRSSARIDFFESAVVRKATSTIL